MSDSKQKQTKIDTKFERPTETDSKETHTHTDTHKQRYRHRRTNTHTVHRQTPHAHTHTNRTQRGRHIHAHTNTQAQTHLLRNILSNYWCGMHRTCTNNPLKSDRIKWLIQREIQWEVCFLRPCSEEGSDVAEPYRLYRKYFQIATSVQWKEKSNERHGGSWV